MKVYLKILLSITLAAFTLPSPVSANPGDQEALAKLFAQHYHSKEFDPRDCGNNVRRFLEDVRRQNLPLEEFKVLSMDNSGTSNFGLFNVANFRFGPFRNWGYHVVALRKGMIYDFSNGYMDQRKPMPVAKNEYLRKMVLDTEPGVFASHNRNDTKLRDYRIKFIDSRDYLDPRSDKSERTISLQEFLDQP